MCKYLHIILYRVCIRRSVCYEIDIKDNIISGILYICSILWCYMGTDKKGMN